MEKHSGTDYASIIVESLRKTETNIQALKTLIQGMESNFISNRGINRRKHRTVSDAVVSKVTPKVPKNEVDKSTKGALQLKKDNCPEWLVKIAEIYQALCKAYIEIQEELQPRCVKYINENSMHLYLKAKTETATVSEERIMKDLTEQFENEQAMYAAEIDQLTKELDKCMTKKEKKETKLRALKSTADVLRSALSEKRQQHKTTLNEIRKREKERKTLEQENTVLLLKIKSSDEEVVNLKTHVNNEKEQLKNLRISWSAASLKMVEYISKLRNSFSHECRKNKELTSKLRLAQTTVDIVKQQLKSLQDARKSLRSRLQERQTCLENVKLAVQKLKEDVARLNDAKHSLEKSRLNRRAEWKETEEQLKISLSVKETVLAERKAALAEESKSLMCLQNQLQECKNTLLQQNQEFKRLYQMQSSDTAKIKLLDEECNNIACKMTQMKFTVNKTKEEFERKDSEFQKQKSYFENNKNELNKTVQVLKESLEEEENRLEEMRENSEHKKSKLRNELRLLQESRAEMKDRIKKLKYEIKRAESCYGTLNMHLPQIEQMCASLQNTNYRELLMRKKRSSDLQEELSILVSKKECLQQDLTKKKGALSSIQNLLLTVVALNLPTLAHLRELRCKEQRLIVEKERRFSILQILETRIRQRRERQRQRMSEHKEYMSAKGREIQLITEQIKNGLSLSKELSERYELLYCQFLKKRLCLPATVLKNVQLANRVQCWKEGVALQKELSSEIQPSDFPSQEMLTTDPILQELQREIEACLKAKDSLVKALQDSVQ